MSRARSLLKLFLLVLLAGCNNQAKDSPAPALVEPAPEVFVAPTAEKPVNEKRQRFEQTLTLSDPSELRVKEGDLITKGQVLSEKQPSQQQLFNRAKLQTQLSEKKSFLEEDQLRSAIASLEAAKQVLGDFDRSSPFHPSTDPAYIPISRTLERNKLVAAVQQAAVTVEASKALVQEARRRAVADQKVLVQQLGVIESELERLKIRSPYSGVVRRLKVERGTNSEIIAKLRIVSDDGKPNTNIPKTDEVSQAD